MNDPINTERADRIERIALSPREAAKALGISRDHLNRAVAEGRITPRAIGNTSRILVSELTDWFRTWPRTYRRT